jgi:hypothetical protein
MRTRHTFPLSVMVLCACGTGGLEKEGTRTQKSALTTINIPMRSFTHPRRLEARRPASATRRAPRMER